MGLKQRSPEWYKCLETTIGGSDIYTIMGKNPFKHPIDLYDELKNPGSRKTFVNEAMQRGTDLEDEAREWYNKRARFSMYQPDCEIHPQHPFLRASLDGIDFSGKRALEIKSPQDNKLKAVKEYGVSDDYYCQIQYQYWFFESLEMIDLLVYQGNDFTTFGRTNGIFPVEKDVTFINAMMDQVFDFYNSLANNNPPSDTRNKTEYEQIDNDFWQTKYKALKEIRERISSDTKTEKEIKEQIERFANGRNLKGLGMSISHIASKGTIDYSIIPELNSIDLERYRRNDYIKTTIRTS